MFSRLLDALLIWQKRFEEKGEDDGINVEMI